MVNPKPNEPDERPLLEMLLDKPSLVKTHIETCIKALQEGEDSDCEEIDKAVGGLERAAEWLGEYLRRTGIEPQ